MRLLALISLLSFSSIAHADFICHSSLADRKPAVILLSEKAMTVKSGLTPYGISDNTVCEKDRDAIWSLDPLEISSICAKAYLAISAHDDHLELFTQVGFPLFIGECQAL